jgi:DNA polymerase-3 subunit delta'
VLEDYAEAIADRVAGGGLYPASSGTDGIYVATVRAIVRSAAMSPAMASRKVFVIGDAERMVPQEGADAAANAFLKLLEEPPADTTIVLTSSEPGALLPTIRSRVVSLRVPRLPDDDVRRFVEDPRVHAWLRENASGETPDELVEAAAGAPGRLLGREGRTEAAEQARRLLESAIASDRGTRYRVALAQSATRARGSFSETLDALQLLLHRRAHGAVMSGDERRAEGAARAMEVVERTKEQAAGNVNPQLLSAALLRDLAALLQ